MSFTLSYEHLIADESDTYLQPKSIKLFLMNALMQIYIHPVCNCLIKSFRIH